MGWQYRVHKCSCGRAAVTDFDGEPVCAYHSPHPQEVVKPWYTRVDVEKVTINGKELPHVEIAEWPAGWQSHFEEVPHRHRVYDVSFLEMVLRFNPAHWIIIMFRNGNKAIMLWREEEEVCYESQSSISTQVR